MDRVVRCVIRESVLRTGALIHPIYDYTVNMVSGVGDEAETLACAVTHTNGPRGIDRAVGTCRCSNRVLVDCKRNVNRVIRDVVSKSVGRSSSLVRAIDDDTVNMVSSVGTEGEGLARTVIHNYSSGRTYRTMGPGSRSNCVLIDRKCNMDRVIRGVVRKSVVRSSSSVDPIDDDT